MKVMPELQPLATVLIFYLMISMWKKKNELKVDKYIKLLIGSLPKCSIRLLSFLLVKSSGSYMNNSW